MLPLLKQAADPELKMYLEQAKKDIEKYRINTLGEIVRRFLDLKDISTDATEQKCYRSQDYKEQEKYFSGKTKQHAIKTQIAVSSTGRIVDVSGSFPGSVHDKNIMTGVTQTT